LACLRQTVIENTLYFPTAAELNDPREAKPRFAASSPDAFVYLIAKYFARANPHWTSDTLHRKQRELAAEFTQLGATESRRIAEETLHPLLRRFRVYSLSKRVNNIHLWERYAAAHTGYCLEFSTKYLGPIREVRYIEGDPELPFRGPMDPNFLFYKKIGWCREEEVRMIDLQASQSLKPFDSRALTGIVLGRRISPSAEAEIREIVGDRQISITRSSDES